MSYWDYVKAEARMGPVFLAVFLGVGVVMDIFVWGQPVNWIERIGVSVIVTIAFVMWTARRKKANSE